MLLLGNNLAFLESPDHAVDFLAVADRLTNPDARIIGCCVDPYTSPSAVDLANHKRNRAAGKPGGHARIRVLHRGLATPWFNHWCMSPQELEQVLESTVWRIAELKKAGAEYLVVLRKRRCRSVTQ